MIRTETHYLNQLLNDFMPVGRIDKSPDSNISKILSVPAKEFAYCDMRTKLLRTEADPRTTYHLLDDWEFCAGLPDACDISEKTLDERRNRLFQKVTSVGGASRFYFKKIADDLGYETRIEEYRPCECGDFECGDYTVEEGDGALLYGLSNTLDHAFEWNMRVYGQRITSFECGISECGDYMANISEAEDLICILSRIKPAHTILTTIYQEDE